MYLEKTKLFFWKGLPKLTLILKKQNYLLVLYLTLFKLHPKILFDFVKKRIWNHVNIEKRKNTVRPHSFKDLFFNYFCIWLLIKVVYKKKAKKIWKQQTTVSWSQVKSETLLKSCMETLLCWGVFEKHTLSFCIACSFTHFTLFIHYFICADKWTRIPLLYLKYIDCAFLLLLLI